MQLTELVPDNFDGPHDIGRAEGAGENISPPSGLEIDTCRPVGRTSPYSSPGQPKDGSQGPYNQRCQPSQR